MGEIGPDERTLLGDGSLAEHEIAGAVDAVCSKEFAITEVEAAEVAVPGGVTAEDDFVVTGVETGDLQLCLLYTSPSPRDS